MSLDTVLLVAGVVLIGLEIVVPGGILDGFTERGKPENLHEYWTFRIKVR